MPVDPEIQNLLDVINAVSPITLDSESAPTMRTMFASMGALMGPGPAGVNATDRSIPGPGGDLPIRVYRPASSEDSAALPVLVWFHGGGFVIGDLDTADSECRRLCDGAGIAAVVSIDYRRAPEHPYPAGVDDCIAATRWVAGHAAELGVDVTRLAVGGDSAGGNLAAVVTQRCREAAGPPIAFQLLVYPTTDAAGEFDGTTYPSMTENAEGYFLTSATMEWFNGCYIPAGADPADPGISPMRAASFADLPPALVLTCGYDPLRDEGRAYADALSAAGVPTTHHCADGGIHGLLAMAALADVGQEFVEVACEGLRTALGTAAVAS